MEKNPIIKIAIPPPPTTTTKKDNNNDRERLNQKPVAVLNYSNLKKVKQLSMEDLSIKREESIDPTSKDLKEEEVKEDIEESMDQRKIRRTTLKNGLFEESARPKNFPDSVDIRNLEGNLFLKEKLNCCNVEAFGLHKSDRRMMKKLQLSFRRVNSYCEVFNRKAEVLVSILLDLLTKYTEGVHKKIFYYDKLKDVYSKWMTIVAKSTVKNSSAIESKKIDFIEKKNKEVNLGLLAPNLLNPNPTTSKKEDGRPERKRAISRNLAFDAISLISALPKLVNVHSKEEEEEREVRRSRSFDRVGLNEGESKEEMVEFENRRRTKSVEYDEIVDISQCTRLNFLRKYKTVLKENKKVISNLSQWNKQLNSRINKLLNGGEIKDILVKINNLLKEFSVVFSKTIRWLKEGEQIYNNLNPEKSLFILEMKICTLMNKFRRILDHNLIETISELNKEVGSIIVPHSQYLIKESKALDHIGLVLYGDEWNSEPLKNNLISKKFQPFNLFGMISAQFRKYMKLKLKLQKNSVVKNEDLIDFFKFYRIKYLKHSPFLVQFIKCFNQTSQKNLTQNDFCLLCLDIFGNVSVFLKKSHENCQFQYPLSLKLFLSSLHVIITLEEKTSDIVLKYSAGGVELGANQKNKSVKVKKVSFKYEDQSECVQFLKCFYTLQKIRFANRGKGKSSKKKPRII